MEKKLSTKIALAATGVVAVAGLAFASPAMAASSKNTTKASSSSSTTGALSWGNGTSGDGMHGHKGKGPKGGFGKIAPVEQSVTVTVPDDGKTYQVVVTDTTVRQAPADAPAGATPPPAHSVVVPVTGTGSVTVKVPGLRPGSYSVKLVAVVSTSSLTVAAPTGTTGATN